MSISDISALIFAWFVVLALFIIFVIAPIIAIFSCILDKIKEARSGAVIISFKNFRRIFSVFADKFSIPSYTKYIYYDHTYKILVKFPFNLLAKMMVCQRARNRAKRGRQKAECHRMREFISALEKDIEKMSKESENYVAQAREIVERIGKQ